MTLFRPCIDLHQGQVKQIVGGSLTDSGDELRTNFASDRPSSYYAELYRKDSLKGGHIIKLGPGNDQAAREALRVYPWGMQIGGGITLDNAESWLDAGASHVILTSWLFDERGNFLEDRAQKLASRVGSERIVIDLSCRKADSGWVVAMKQWQMCTNLIVSADSLSYLSQYCAEFLVHAADVEGKCEGIDSDLVIFLGEHSNIPVTYAGGVSAFDDLSAVDNLSRGRVDLTIGSALDLFGGTLVSYRECVQWNHSSAL